VRRALAGDDPDVTSSAGEPRGPQA
jgi:hypothetical protein